MDVLMTYYHFHICI